MNEEMLKKTLLMLSSSEDSNAVMGLRSLQALLQEEGTDLVTAVTFAMAHLDDIRKKTVSAVPPSTPDANEPVAVSGMPRCRMVRSGVIELIAPDCESGETATLPAIAAQDTEHIALHLQDALAAAVINKSRFKLKLFDVKNGRGETIETVLQAEYERSGMAPVRIWVNVKGEAGALAAVLRKTLAAATPDLIQS